VSRFEKPEIGKEQASGIGFVPAKVSVTASMWVPLVKPFLSSGQLSLHP
jgi:hypothetical protein